MNISHLNDSQRSLLSIMCAVFGFGLFSLADACVKYLGGLGYHTFTMQLYATLIASVIAVTYILLHKRSLSGFVARKPFRYHVYRGLFLLGGVYFLINTLQILDMAEFYAIAFLSPFLVTLSAAFFFKEHVGWQRWFAVIGGFSGVLIAVSGYFFDEAIMPPVHGLVYGLLMVCCFTASFLVIRKMGHGEYPPLYPFYAQIFIGTFSIAMIILMDVSTPMPPMEEWWIWGVYGAAVFLAVIFSSSAFTIAPVAAIPAPFQYTQIIWGVLFGYFIFNEIPRNETLAGLCIIIASGLFMVWREYKAKQVLMDDVHDH